MVQASVLPVSASARKKGELDLNTTYLENAKARVPNVPLLINMVSRRVRHLIGGERPLVKPDSPYMEKIDIALREIGEGKLTFEMLPEESADQPLERPSSLMGGL